MGISETGNFDGTKSREEEIVDAIKGLTSEVEELGNTIYALGVGLGCFSKANDVLPVKPSILAQIAASLDILAGKADNRVRRIP
jgi:hypothetical protein